MQVSIWGAKAVKCSGREDHGGLVRIALRSLRLEALSGGFF